MYQYHKGLWNLNRVNVSNSEEQQDPTFIHVMARVKVERYPTSVTSNMSNDDLGQLAPRSSALLFIACRMGER